MEKNFKRNLLIGFGISLLILIANSIGSFVSINNLISSSDWVDHTNEVINNLNGIKIELLNAETAQRGYLIAGEEVFLEPFQNAEEKTLAFLDKAQMLTSDNPVQQQNINDLRPMIKERIDLLEENIVKKRNNIPITDGILKGKNIMDKTSSIISRMIEHEQELMKIRTASASKFANYSVLLNISATIIAFVISIFFFMKILKDYTERVKLQDQLVEKDEETAKRIKIISGIASEISGGNYKTRIDDKEGGELGSVSLSLNSMAKSLDDSFESLREKEWLQAGISGLNDALIGEKDMQVLTKDVIDYVAAYTNSQAGVLFLAEGKELRAQAGYCYTPDKSRQTILIGEGLVGEAVLSGKYKELTGLSDDDIEISYAMGKVKPKHVVAIPLMDTVTVGAFELASSTKFTKNDLEFLQSASGRISVAITAALNRKRVQSLLEETQTQSEELQAQHSELENINAELEAQSQKLMASEEELRVQQEELQQTNEELKERSVLLEEKNTEIQKKSEDLELTTRYKSEFLANMSHELRTPLNSILLLSRLLSENNDKNMNEEQIEFAKVIQNSGNGLLGLIDEILDLSKIEAGKMELEFNNVTVKEISDDIRSLFKEVAKAKQIEFEIEIAPEMPPVIKTDKVRLDQILKNLISNAIKFTAKGSVKLIIQPDPQNEKNIHFSVKDTGIGIAREKQPIIFDAFQQADGSTKRKYGGTGLGLSISKELAKLLGGNITLKSKLNEGSEFTLSVPKYGSAMPVTVKDEKETEEKESPVEKTSNYISATIPADVEDDRNNLTEADKVILIIEDDTNFAKALLDFSRKKGYKVIVTVRGDEALNLALAFKPVGILLDLQLPVKSGWEVMEELKSNPQTKHIPVHIMSSHKLKRESLLKGAVDFLDKPVVFEQMHEVFTKIEQLVNKKSQKVLIIEDNHKHAKALAYYLETFNINSEIKSDISEGFEVFNKKEVDCVILDMGIPDAKAYEVLEKLKNNSDFGNLPVIVFTGKSLSMAEEVKIRKYADSIIIKTVHSYNRMLDEVSLFLHLVEENKQPDEKKSNKLGKLKSVLSEKTVLIVDDDVRNIYSLSKSLEVLKMNVLTAIDGKEALDILKENPNIDIILMDMMMPNMDGYEATSKIRQMPGLKNLPVIAVTAKAMTGDREKCIKVGASDYITKPVDIDQLLSLLRVWLYDKA